MDADHAWHDEWSLYFNVACQLYPDVFAPCRPELLAGRCAPGTGCRRPCPTDPAFENYYSANYAPDGMFAGLSPRGDREAKIDRALAAFARARHAEFKGSGAHTPGDARGS
jgi:hypothetical protein